MHVTFVSACQKKSWPKTRSILDSYAMRIGPRTWKTPITTEGLQEVHTLLRRNASRNTSVVCFRNQGVNDLKLLWNVGNLIGWGTDGHYAVGRTNRKAFNPNFYMRYSALLAKLSGLSHDWGKAESHFQEKLKKALKGERTERDPIHHAWLSMLLIAPVLSGASWQQAWKSISTPEVISDGAERLNDLGITDVQGALEFITGTHHRLFGSEGGYLVDEGNVHLTTSIRPDGDVDLKILDDFQKNIQRLQRMNENRVIEPEKLKGISLFSRAALILADHYVSNSKYGCDPIQHKELLANTRYAKQSTKRNSRPKAYQSLNYHLAHVGQNASKMMSLLYQFNPEGLSPFSIERILEESKAPYEWQNVAVNECLRVREAHRSPVLVFNCAQTGSGKTIANAKIACALGGPKVRFSIALNLRTLTLQTGDSLRQDLGLGDSEVAAIIGSKVVEKLHNSNKSFFDHDFTVPTVYGERFNLPEWTDVVTRGSSSYKTLLGVPVLASTIDYIIDAGNPGRQGHHVGALLRVMSSDLILDEIDGYEPSAMGAVLRLVFMAALCGRNVICSSATLPATVAQAIRDAFLAGRKSSFFGPKDTDHGQNVLLLHDKLEPVVLDLHSFSRNDYLRFVAQLDSVSTHSKKAYIAPCHDEESFLNQIKVSTQKMHKENNWSLYGKKVSFGLIRIANISTIRKVSDFLLQELPEAKIATYHADLFLIDRFLKEKHLDLVLNRKSNKNIESCPYIKDVITSCGSKDIMFIVIASPVEEVGRDHDFDWGVIEPSSIESIIQVAGRINRHRKTTIERPNITILDRNYRSVKGESSCFVWPGVEKKGDANYRYRSQRVSELLNKKVGEEFYIEPFLRFDQSVPFVIDEDDLIQRQIADAVKAFDIDDPRWMGTELYRQFTLRGGQEKRTNWRLVPTNDEAWHVQRFDASNNVWLTANFTTSDMGCNAWLSWTVEELLDACVEHNLDAEVGMQAEIRGDHHHLFFHPVKGLHHYDHN